MTELEARGLSVRFGDLLALADLDVRARSGEFVAIVGPSGAGKSTLLWALAGALDVTSGLVRCDNSPVSDRACAVRLGIGLIPQGNGLAGVLTAYENILVPLLAGGLGSESADQRARDALEAVGLADSGDHLVEELSGGQQQRVAVARGLAGGHPVLLADEPTSELDHRNRELVLALLREHADTGAIVVMSTHDLEAAARADLVVHLDGGRTVPAAGPVGPTGHGAD